MSTIRAVADEWPGVGCAFRRPAEAQLYGYDGIGYDGRRAEGFVGDDVRGDVDAGRTTRGYGERQRQGEELAVRRRERGDRDGVYHDVEDRGVVGRDTSGPTTDDAMTRSEEHQQVTVPVSHEEISLDREPIAEANRGNAYGGPAISEEEHEVTLHAERPVVDTEAVAVERVRLGTRPAASDDSDRCRICHPGRHLSSRTGSCTGWWAVLGRTEARPRAVNPPQSTARGRCGSTFRHAEILGGASHQSGGWGASQRVRCAVCPPPRSGRRRGPVAMQPARCQMSTSRRRAGVATIPDICSGALPLGRFAPALNRNPDVVSHRNTGRRSP